MVSDAVNELKDEQTLKFTFEGNSQGPVPHDDNPNYGYGNSGGGNSMTAGYYQQEGSSN